MGILHIFSFNTPIMGVYLSEKSSHLCTSLMRKGVNEKKCKLLKKFIADIIHSGSSYINENIRIHSYLDSPFIKRVPNRTWVVRESSKQI